MLKRKESISFNTEMIEALLDGRKTQTRRVVKPQPIWVGDPSVPFKTHDADPKGIIQCPYGQPGSLLWVRETFATDGHRNVCYRESVGKGESPREGCVYADGSEFDGDKWTPSICMPRWASRLTLEITNVRVERVQEIAPDDCIAEAVWRIEEREFGRGHEAIEEFSKVWESCYPGTWDKNPWVWVIKFKLHKKNIDELLAGRGAA